MKHAFEKAGLKKEDMEFFAHCERYFKSGGEYEPGLALYKQAAEKLGKTATTCVPEGQLRAAVISHPMPEGHMENASSHVRLADGLPIPSEGQAAAATGQTYHADARSLTLSGGHTSNFQSDPHKPATTEQPQASGEANGLVPAKATRNPPPVRDPDEAFRRALTRDRIQNATIWLELNKTSDGRAWSKVCPYEFAGMERDARTVHHIKTIWGEFNPKQMRTPLGQLMPAHLQQKLANRVQLMEARHAG